MKIDLNVNAMAVTPRLTKAASDEVAGGDFERMLEDASNGARPAADEPVEQPREQTAGNAEAQKAAPEEADAQELPGESPADDQQESAEAAPVEENLDGPVVTVAATPAVVEEVVEGAVEEVAAAVKQGSAPRVSTTRSTPESADPGLSVVQTAAAKIASEIDAQSAAPAVQEVAEAKPQGAAAPVVTDSAEVDSQAVLNQATYKPVVSAKPQAEEVTADVKPPVSAAAAKQPETAAISTDTAAQQQPQERNSSQREDLSAQVSATVKPQAAEAAESPQTFNASPAPAPVQVEASSSNTNIDAPPPVSATAPADGPRPTSAPGAPAAQQALHAQRQERDEQRVAEQALRAMRGVVNQRGGSLTLRLHPPELGDLRIRLEMTQHVVSARLEASTDAVRQLLQQQLPQLHSALSSHGLTVDQIQVQTQTPEGQRSSQDQNTGGDGRSRGGFERQQQRGEDRRQQQDDLSRFQRELLDLVA